MAFSNTLKEVRKRVLKESQDALMDQGKEYVNHVVSRTLRGVGINERKFKHDYAPSTARRKGRIRPVTLRDSFQMLSDLYAKRVSDNQVEVRFRSREDEKIGRWQHFGTQKDGEQRIPPREWFGYTTRFARKQFQEHGKRVRRAVPKDRRKRFKIEVGS